MPAKLPRGQALKKFLNEHFGLDDLREGQAEVIRSVLAKKNTLAVMPTGAGKSLCYQVPALLMPGTTVVVSPLIALMKDQQEKLTHLDIDAVGLNSTLGAAAQHQAERRASQGKTEFVYVTPERLATDEFLKSMQGVLIDLLVLDEAHCLSQWGHDFRPAYLEVRKAWIKLGKPPVLALTATATDEVIEDLQQQLGMKLEVFHSGVLRPNLRLEALAPDGAEGKDRAVTELLREEEGSAIVYASTIREVERLHELLIHEGIANERYHGKMRTADRHAAQDRFMSGQTRVMVATNAFGMGIDKPDIRMVVHYAFPGTLEAYYQEAGRAGRDGKPARCVLLYLKRDKSTQSFFMAGRYPSAEQIEAVTRILMDIEEPLNAARVAELTRIPKSKAAVILSALRDEGLINAHKSDFKLHQKSIPREQAELILEKYRHKKENDRAKLKAMIVYAQSALCRWKNLLKYFGQESEWDQCEACDNCARLASQPLGALRHTVGLGESAAL